MRLVVDTNVFISAVLYTGLPNKLVNLWQKNETTFLLSNPILLEYIRVLNYPKFKLTKQDIKIIIEEELLPFIHPVEIKQNVTIIKTDPSDNIFLSTAIDGNADYILSGDNHLLELKKYKNIHILSIREFFNNQLER